jgi:hypothetical protein
MMDTLSQLQFQPITKLANITSGWDPWSATYCGTGMMQATRINDFSLCVFGAETPMEVPLYVSARLNDWDNVMVVGYGNFGGGEYWNWDELLAGMDIQRWCELTVRGINILKNLMQ